MRQYKYYVVRSDGKRIMQIHPDAEENEVSRKVLKWEQSESVGHVSFGQFKADSKVSKI